MVTSIVSLIDVVWLHFSHHSVRLDDIENKAKATGILILLAAMLLVFSRIPRYRSITAWLRCAEASRTLAWYALLICFVAATGVLSYLCVSINAPLIDNTLIRFDRALGFDWPAVYQWTQSHPYAYRILAYAYMSGGFQFIMMPAILGLSGHGDELSEFIFLVMLSIILLLLVSTPFPATSAFIHFKVADPNALSTVSHFALLRDGTMRTFDLASMQGLVSFPSYHTALAVLFVYALRRIPLLFWCAMVVNTAMIISTPTQGGHYLADVIAGLLFAILTIWALKLATRQRSVRAYPVLGNAAIRHAIHERHQ